MANNLEISHIHNLTDKDRSNARTLGISDAEFARREATARKLLTAGSRVGRLAAKTAVAAGLTAGAVVGYTHIVPDEKPSVPHETTTTVPDRTPKDVVHTVKAGENPWTISEEYNTIREDIVNMDQDIAAQDADAKGNIHPGQHIKISDRATDFRP
ncbi:MAG TPA: LysM domain-containing protein [Patescibacteria group bacterium]|nr:LysM domain-containing protein [Patescibacteria group bacterium]